MTKIKPENLKYFFMPTLSHIELIDGRIHHDKLMHETAGLESGIHEILRNQYDAEINRRIEKLNT